MNFFEHQEAARRNTRVLVLLYALAVAAVVAVTRGTLETLNRDELQGVVGHEFSHILHGDMRLNIRMIGVLAGIVFIGSIGRLAMRATGRGGARR